MGRVSTGIPALDEMLQGGLLPHRPYLVVGPSGTGKTTLALQFLVDGVRRGEKCLMVTLEEPPNEMRLNHRGFQPEMDSVYVFDAIPDVMRYERAPFKDIAAVRESIPFGKVPLGIRQTAELASVEVTFTALEQTLKSEVARQKYHRIAIDSLTALQYFCMKGFDETLGAQTFLRFLSDLRVTTLLTVEAPLEDIESPERLLARGEIRLFRWELDSVSVRAIGVEKFRGSEHDIRLHPYRISPRGIDINLAVTISRDTRQVLPPAFSEIRVATEPVEPPVEISSGLATLEQDTLDLSALGISPAPIVEAIGNALTEARAGHAEPALRLVGRARGLVLALFGEYRQGAGAHDASPPARRLIERVATVRAGVPPISVPSSDELARILGGVSERLSLAGAARPSPPKEPPAPPAVSLRPPSVSPPVSAAPAPPAPPPPPLSPVRSPVLVEALRATPPPGIDSARPPPPASPVRAPAPPSFDFLPRRPSPPPLPPPSARPPPPPPRTPLTAGRPDSTGATPASAPGPSGSRPGMPTVRALVAPNPVPSPGPPRSAAPLGSAPTSKPPPSPPPSPAPAEVLTAPSPGPISGAAGTFSEPGGTAKRKRRVPPPSGARRRVSKGIVDLAATPGEVVGAEGKLKRRRPPARRKAPPVTSAEPGSPPPEELRVAGSTDGPPPSGRSDPSSPSKKPAATAAATGTESGGDSPPEAP